MCSIMLKICGRKLTPVITRQCLPSLGVGNFLLDKKPHGWETPYLTLNSLSKQKGYYMGLPQPKFCSSAGHGNPSPTKEMKERMNRYIRIISKGNELNLAHFSLASKNAWQTLRTDIAELKSCPTPPLVLGFGALAPFVAVPMHFLMSAAFAPGFAYGQLAYGAVFLSFLGGIRCGVALSNPEWDNLTKSVTLSLIGWSSLLVPHWLGCLTLSAGLISSTYSYRKHPQYKPWLRSLIATVSTVAILSIASSFLLGLILPVSKN